MAETPHPRETDVLEGCEVQVAAFEDALARGRMHHAWLLTGPEGVGKATFAHHAAFRLLGAADTIRLNPEEQAVRLARAGAHPDLTVLERPVENGRVKKVIPVDEARRLPEFFAKSPSVAQARVAIIDAADDMNPNAANAVLKILEEPPANAVLFLVSHSPGRLLDTIRSRCRKLRFPPWEAGAITAFLERRGVGGDQASRLAALSGGGPGLAWRLAGTEALDLADLAERLVEGPPPPDAELIQASDRFRGADGADRFEFLFNALADQVRRRAEAGGGERDADLWRDLSRAVDDADAINLDRAEVFLGLAGRLKGQGAHA
ncbi:DNA polymerase III subunit delta' [Brevundimonas sp. 2R-24]|uniref:DNA polymerase III subunit delta n=1 Tax=Peiella sedimenti TaxID=3061083 RepID=A0ABT8SJA1_9CAUL|nr:DNA polymerase III subunit delta' [Caulobacteraceae bacterium XZ-24]